LCLRSDVSETRSMNRTRFLHISTSKDDLTILNSENAMPKFLE
jgi:hypothetical protein